MRVILISLFAAVCSLCGFAQEKGTETTEPGWYVNMEWGGYEFELPAGTVVEKGDKFIAKYPDGSFGVSMGRTLKKGFTQKIAADVCRKTAASMELRDVKVEKVKAGRASGAKGTGTIEGQQVTVLVLPYDGGGVTTVLLATPNRTGWVEHFVESLR